MLGREGMSAAGGASRSFQRRPGSGAKSGRSSRRFGGGERSLQQVHLFTELR